MQNSPGIPLAAFVVASALAGVTIVSLMVGAGGDPALNELQIGATAGALTLGIFGVQGIVSIVLEGRRLFLGTIEPRLDNRLSSAIGALQGFHHGILAPNAIWPMHIHEDLQGVTYVVEGALEHSDSLATVASSPPAACSSVGSAGAPAPRVEPVGDRPDGVHATVAGDAQARST